MFPKRACTGLALAACALLLACSCSTSSGGTKASGGAAATDAPAKLFDTDFKGVCSGATVSRARAYDKAQAAGHKVVYFATVTDDVVDSSTSLPTDWAVQFDANADTFAATDLVACAVRTGDTYVKDCSGYTVDDKPTQNIAKLHAATYTLTVHEATTGNTLGTTDLAASDDTCPMFISFQGDNDTVDYYDPPSTDQVVAFIKPFAQPGS